MSDSIKIPKDQIPYGINVAMEYGDDPAVFMQMGWTYRQIADAALEAMWNAIQEDEL